MSQIFGRRVLLDDLTLSQRRALVGERVAACCQRNTDEFDEWDIGTVVSAEPEDAVVLWIRFDSSLDKLGCFEEEHIIILSIQEVI